MSDQRPQELTIKAIIRDFRADHPDFEVDRFMGHPVEKGIVKAVLGPDGKPEYNEQHQHITTSGSKASFDEWYRDVAGKNKTVEYPLVFKHKDGDVFAFEQDEFFPIDNHPASFGNQPKEMFTVDANGQKQLTDIGQMVMQKNGLQTPKWEYDLDHNYHFTMEVVTKFKYRGTEKFEFFGDDDLWVFIDGKLVIDLGGLHESDGRFLDLRLGRGDNSATDKSTTLKLKLKANLGIDHASDDLELVLEKGKEYDLRFFYAERHTLKSVCRIATSLWLETPPPPPVPVLYKVRIDAIRDALEPSYPLPGQYGTFQITLDRPAPVGGMTVRYELVKDNSAPIAIENIDFNLDPAVREVKIPAGKESVLINVIPLEDRLQEGREAVIAKITEKPDVYKVSKAQDTVFIRDVWRGDKLVCVAPVRTIIRREEEVVLVRKVRKVEEVDASPACPINSVQVTQVHHEN